MKSGQNPSTYRIARWVMIAVVALAGAAAMAVAVGYADPYVPLSFPFGYVLAVALLWALAYGGYKGALYMERWTWEAVGRQVGLTPGGAWLDGEKFLHHGDDASIKKPILTGDVRGYPVQAQQLRKTERSAHQDISSPSKKVITIVEADLGGVVDEGVVVEAKKSGFLSRVLSGAGLIDTVQSAPGESEIFVEAPNVPGSRFTALASPPELARAVLSGPSRDAINEIQSFNRMLVGNVEGAFQAALPDPDEIGQDTDGLSAQVVVGQGIWKKEGDSRIRGSARTVTHFVEDKTKVTPVPSSDELKRVIDAVVAVAEAFERARHKASAEERV